MGLVYDSRYKALLKNINNLLKKAINQYLQDTIQVFQIWHNMFKTEILKCILAIQRQLTNRPQVITNQTDHR